jgi:hypothetical protein
MASVMNYRKANFQHWGVYLLALTAASFLHEIGHCLPAWLNGYGAIPTPAKECALSILPDGLVNYVSLGGVSASALLPIVALAVWMRSQSPYAPLALAATLAMPSLYALRFLLTGRGHDATEFQEAQAALGVAYSGHFMDWLFVAITVAGATAWIIKTKPRAPDWLRLLAGAIATVAFLVVLQKVNNLVFDPLFS